MKTCKHIQEIKEQIPKSQFINFECEECMKIKSYWIQLRICQTCGKMLCCDSSPNQHSRKHFEKTDHAVITSAEMGDTWIYCFEDDLTV